MKDTNKVRRQKLRLAPQTIRVLTTDHLRLTLGGNIDGTGTCDRSLQNICNKTKMACDGDQA
jgi:hypothetical protein